jgi:hypothetical protein
VSPLFTPAGYSLNRPTELTEEDTVYIAPPDYVEFRIACRVLGVSAEQSLRLCKLVGVKPEFVHDDWFLRRDALDVLYRRLYPELAA